MLPHRKKRAISCPVTSSSANAAVLTVRADAAARRTGNRSVTGRTIRRAVKTAAALMRRTVRNTAKSRSARVRSAARQRAAENLSTRTASRAAAVRAAVRRTGMASRPAHPKRRIECHSLHPPGCREFLHIFYVFRLFCKKMRAKTPVLLAIRRGAWYTEGNLISLLNYPKEVTGHVCP